MTDNAYVTGSWLALIDAGAAVLVDDQLPSDQRDALWQAVRAGAQAPKLVAIVAAGASPSDVRVFGLVTLEGEQIRVMVRAGVTAVVTDAAGQAHVIDSGGVSTTVEYVAHTVSRVTVSRAGAPSGAPSLPISAGVVVADSFSWHPPGVALRADSPVAPAVAEETEPETDTQTETPGDVLIDDVPDARDTPVDDWFDMVAADPPPNQLAFEQANRDAIDVSDDDSEQSLRAAFGDHDGYTVARAAMTALHEGTASASMVQAVSCSQSHLNAPQAQRCRICAEVLPDQDAVPAPRPSLGSLRFSTGQVVELDSRIVVGRSPSVEGLSGAELPQLVQVESRWQDISRSHLEVRLEGWHVLLVDLDSANGTVVMAPGRSPERLHPGDPYPLVPGAVVDLAGEVTFRYEVLA